MILNCKKTAKYISNWLKNETNKIGKKLLAVHLECSCESYLNAILCKKAGINTICIETTYDGNSPYVLETNKKFAEEFGLQLLQMDITNSIKNISTEVVHGGSKFDKKIEVYYDVRRSLEFSALSCLTKYLDGLVVSNTSRNFFKFYRRSDSSGVTKYGGVFDLFPLADLYLEEILKLLEFVSDNSKTVADMAMIDSEFGELELTFPGEFEWMDTENTNSGIIESDEDPVRHREWARYTGRQRKIIAKTHQLEKLSRRLHNPNLSVCEIRHKENLVR